MSGFKTTMDKISNSPFFTFSKLPMEFIEKEKIFKYTFNTICVLIAVLTLLLPFVILIRTISSGYFNFGFKYVLGFIFMWLAIAAACWLGFHLWWKRQKKSAEFKISEFVVIPFFSIIIKTIGEWLGILLCIIGFVGGLFGLIFLGFNGAGTLSVILFDMSGLGVFVPEMIVGIFSDLPIILGPIFGLLVIFVTRFFSEGLWALAAIANNTKISSLYARKNNNESSAHKNPSPVKTVPNAERPIQPMVKPEAVEKRISEEGFNN